jgi:tetratricopeptide (TPR) repeat protein
MKRLIFLLLSLCLYTEGYSQTAEEYFKIGIAKYNFGYGDHREAIPYFSKAIEINPKYDLAYHYRGCAKYDLGDYRGAISDFSKAIERNPKDAGEYYLRGSAKKKLGDKNGACLDWSKAGELGNFGAYDMIKKHCN